MSRAKKVLIAALAYSLTVTLLIQRRRWWVHPMNLRRDLDGEHIKVNNMYRNYPDRFGQYTRMTPFQFDKFEKLVTPYIKIKPSQRKQIPIRTRLLITLRYLATGDHYQTIATKFSVGKATVGLILDQCLPAIWSALSPEYVQVSSYDVLLIRNNDFHDDMTLKFPKGEEWMKIMKGFDERWNFPFCIGALDGKHVVMEKPNSSGSLYLNYKGTFSIVLLASCDSKCRFTYVNVGAYGKQSDGGVLAASSLGKFLKNGNQFLNKSFTIPGSNTSMNPVFVADEAFPLSLNMMRPFAQASLTKERRIFNYRLSRARRTIENAFGIMAGRFRVFRRPMNAQPKKAESITLAAVALHNFLLTEEAELNPNLRSYCPPGYSDTSEFDGSWRNEAVPTGLVDIPNLTVAAHEKEAKKVRQDLTTYFSGAGILGWELQQLGLQ